MAISFKVTIPPGSLLEKELMDKNGRQRTHHLYLLGEIGARVLPNFEGSLVDNKKTEKAVIVKDSESEIAIKQSNDVFFNQDDLLAIR